MGLIHLTYIIYEATGRGHPSSIDYILHSVTLVQARDRNILNHHLKTEDGNIEQQAQLKSYQWVIQY